MRWSVIPAEVIAGHHWLTLLSAVFMHASWSHIIGNVVFLWAFGPAIEDAMGPVRYVVFYVLGGLISMLAQIAALRGKARRRLEQTAAEASGERNDSRRRR